MSAMDELTLVGLLILIGFVWLKTTLWIMQFLNLFELGMVGVLIATSIEFVGIYFISLIVRVIKEEI